MTYKYEYDKTENQASAQSVYSSHPTDFQAYWIPKALPYSFLMR